MNGQADKRPTLRQVEELLKKVNGGQVSREHLQAFIDGRLIKKTKSRQLLFSGKQESSVVYDIGNRITRLIRRGYHKRQPGGEIKASAYRKLWPERVCMPAEYVARGYNHVALVDIAISERELIRGKLTCKHSIDTTADCVHMPSKRDGSPSLRYILFVHLDHKLCVHRKTTVRDALDTLLPDERGMTTLEVLHWVTQLKVKTDGFRCVAAGTRFGSPGVPKISFEKRNAVFDGINIDVEQPFFYMPVAGATAVAAADVVLLG